MFSFDRVLPYHRPCIVGFAALFLTGCAALDLREASGPALNPTSGVALKGQVHGGQQAVSGAAIQLYAAGSTGYGSAATALIPLSAQVAYSGPGTGAMTDANGGFQISGDYVCPSPTSQVYITATGGNPGLASPTNNANIGEMAALGACGNLGSSTFIIMNEVTTAAAVWSLQQFIGVTAGTTLAAAPGINGSGVLSTPAFTIGTSPSNAQGLANAFAMAQIIANNASGTAYTSYTSTVPNSTTKYLPDYFTINLVGNILSSCVNSATPACSLLSTTATFNGTAPADTLQAAYAMAINPVYNVASLTALAPATSPFAPASASQNDFSVQVSITPSTTVGKYVDNAVDIEFDQFGNMWTTNTCHGTSGGACNPTTTPGEFVSEFDGLGNPLGSLITGYNLGSVTNPNVVPMTVSATFNNQFTLAIDQQNNPWVADFTDGVIFRIPGSSAYGVAPAVSGSAQNLAISTGTMSGPTGVAVDPAGTVWFAGWGNPLSATGVGTWSASTTFPSTNIRAYGGIAPGTSVSSGGPLTGGFYANVSPGAQDTYAMVVDLTPPTTYSGAPFIFANDSANNTYGQLHQLVSTSGSTPGSTSTTTLAQGAETAISPLGDSELTASQRKTSLADNPAVSFNGSTFDTYATKGGQFGAVDSSNNLWLLNNTQDSASTTFPYASLSKLALSYAASGTTGALTTTSATSTVFTSTTLANYASASNHFSAPVKIDGGNNIWLAVTSTATGNPYATWIEFSNSGVDLTAGSSGFGLVGSTQTAYIRGPIGHRTNAIDASGNVWSSATNTGGDAFYVLVGQAVPTVNPLSKATATSISNPTATYGRIGARP